MKIFNKLFGGEKEQSTESFAGISRCGCECGRPLNPGDKVEVLEGKTFLNGHVPASWREHARIKQQERDAAAQVAQRTALESSRLAAYRAAKDRLAAITGNITVLELCGVDANDLRSTAEDEVAAAEKLLSNEQRELLGLPPKQTSSAYVVPLPGRMAHRPFLETGH